MDAIRRRLEQPALACAAVSLVGALVWVAATHAAPLRLSWSDEIVYAVMGRNLAAGRGAISSFYDARSILAKGYPLGDVHMPGHAIALGLAFRILGSAERVAFVPSMLAYLASGPLLLLAARRVGGQGVGAAALIYVFPSLAGYACSAMAETPLVCLGCAHLLLWLRVVDRPTWPGLVGLVLLLGLGATVRETFFALLVPTVLALFRVPRGRRLGAAIVFAACLVGYIALVFRPLFRARAPYPNYLADLLAGLGPRQSVAALLDNAVQNLRLLVATGAGPETWTTRLVLALGLVAPLGLLVRRDRGRSVAAYALATTLATIVPLLLTYTLESWTGLRVVLLALPGGLLALTALIGGEIRPGVRRGAVVLTACVTLALSWAVERKLVLDRLEEHAAQAATSLSIEHAFRCPGPHVVVAEEAFLYGWRAFPATVVWRGTLPVDALARLGTAAGAGGVVERFDELAAVGCRLATGAR